MENKNIYFQLPEWLIKYENKYKDVIFKNDEEKMEIAIEISKQNILNNTGGPFGCAIFKLSEDKQSSTLFCVGCNLVTTYNNCILHAEIVAIQVGQKKINNYSFNNSEEFELFTSCEPCAMCLGAILWSGVKRIICGATKKDAEEIGFNEGPVFPQSYVYLENMGLEIKKNILNGKCKEILNLYKNNKGEIYNS